MCSFDLQPTSRCAKRYNFLEELLAVPKQSRVDLNPQAYRGIRSSGFLLFGLLFSIISSGPAKAQVVKDATSSHDQSTPSETNSASITTRSGGELILAFISTDSLGSSNITVQSIKGGGLTWTLVVRSNAQAGTSEIWRALAPSSLSASVTASLSQTVVSSITLTSYKGSNTTGVNGSGSIGAIASSSSSKGAPTSSLIPLSTASLIVGVGNDYDSAIARTPVSGQSLVHQDLSPTGDTYWVQQFNADNTIKGTQVTLADSSPNSDRYNLAICEIRPATANTASMSFSSSSLNFGNVVDGSSDSASIILTSSGTASLVISSDAVSGTGYSLGNVTLPKTLTPGQSLTLPVTFSPKTAGASSGTLTIKSNSVASASGTASIALTGSGVGASHSVSLSWQAPSTKTDPVVGYYVYRTTAGGASSVLNYTVNTATSYVDTTADGGITYSYDVKSVDAEGVQSPASNTFTIAVPNT